LQNAKEKREVLLAKLVGDAHELGQCEGCRLLQELVRELVVFVRHDSGEQGAENPEKAAADNFLLGDVGNLALSLGLRSGSHVQLVLILFVRALRFVFLRLVSQLLQREQLARVAPPDLSAQLLCVQKKLQRNVAKDEEEPGEGEGARAVSGECCLNEQKK